ncbi:vomeronasal type-1 receptor 90-like [Tachyglossus aculeatus]|uniref:vomeronasal type-1 receptor 90-like n=1 Tax=Tachyglossus aculeatus TaxID=9261 RepID=UPI0018F47AF3|nr:vomeronasal type-1 receptor 90-like [Tachyglossus aculeatus]
MGKRGVASGESPCWCLGRWMLATRAGIQTASSWVSTVTRDTVNLAGASKCYAENQRATRSADRALENFRDFPVGLTGRIGGLCPIPTLYMIWKLCSSSIDAAPPTLHKHSSEMNTESMIASYNTEARVAETAAQAEEENILLDPMMLRYLLLRWWRNPKCNSTYYTASLPSAGVKCWNNHWIMTTITDPASDKKIIGLEGDEDMKPFLINVTLATTGGYLYQKAVSIDVAQEVCFLFQSGVGIMGNSLLNMFYLSSFLLGSKPKPTDLVIIHLALVHTVMLLTRWITRTAVILRLRLIQTNAECKLFAYVCRITRGLSICTTSLLSMVQAITISPTTSYLFQLKIQIPNFILPVLAILWILNMLISTQRLYQVVASHNATTIAINCYTMPSNTLLQRLIVTLMALRDILSLGLMSCSNGFMVLLLHRRRLQVQHIHSTGQAPETLPERRATKIIMLLVSCFVVLHCGDFVLSLFRGTYIKNNVTLVNASMFVVNGHATISPFVLLTCDTRVIKFLGDFLGNKTRRSSQTMLLSAIPL